MRFVLPGVPPTGTCQNRSYRNGISYPNESLKRARTIYEQVADFAPPAPMEGPLEVWVTFVRPPTKGDLSTKAKRARFDDGGLIWCESKPDCDNAAKVLLDAMARSRFFLDDKQIVLLHVRKVRGLNPLIEVMLYLAPSHAPYLGGEW